MELGTFGAIMRFALELEEKAEAFYQEPVHPALEPSFRQRQRECRRRRGQLETARREGVAEMILESITGLDSDAYPLALNPEADEVRKLHQAIALEETLARFCRDAAAKMPIREIARLFGRLADEHLGYAHELAALGRNREEAATT